MPCEGCNVQFTVFKRKRLCYECRRFYCNHCLIKRNERILCERCVILTARPLSKIDLLKLKPKDLIFYLQSKHVSTTGCVEKEELVNLILNHVNNSLEGSQTCNGNTSQGTFEAPQGDSFENCSNPFDQIKHTCQSLFTSLTEKIVDFNSENKTANPNANPSPENVATSQPRVHTREMPTYASSTQAPNWPPSSNAQSQSSNPGSSSSTSGTDNANRPTVQSPSPSNPSSPIISLSSMSSNSLSSQPRTTANIRYANTENIPSVHRGNIRKLIDNIQDVNATTCDCSDDEILTSFNNQRAIRSADNNPASANAYAEKLSPPSQADSAFEDQIPGPSGSGSAAQSVSPSKISSGDLHKSSEESESGSSFEELGAVGGTGDWQIVNKVDIQGPMTTALQTNPSDAASQSFRTATFQLHSNIVEPGNETTRNSQKQRRINRRRSDGSILNSASNRHGAEAMELGNDSDDGDDRESGSCKRVRKCCNKCGKTKNTLKRQLIKLHRQLESAQMSETEIKQEIEEFLQFLEKRSKDSFDCSDTESNADGPMQYRTPSTEINTIRPVANHPSVLDDGIHVYALRSDDPTTGSWRNDGRFLNLEDFKSSSELDDLSVKQLKEILMVNRVDFKGCCEKQELLERVNRLWNDLHSSPAVDKLQTDDLCKICMDAPIECVILECGHMATCTNCGKVLSECPICRQYIVRVVRFFRA